MLNIQRALENERPLRALTGLNRQAFNKPLTSCAKPLDQSIKRALTTTPAPATGQRQGEESAIRKYRDESMLRFVLLQVLPAFDVLGFFVQLRTRTRPSVAASFASDPRNHLGQENGVARPEAKESGAIFSALS